MPIFEYLKVREFQARGGPLDEDIEQQKTRTREGRYVIAAIGKHKSASRWMWSTVAWGTPLRNEKGNIQINQNGLWVNLSSLKSFNSFKSNEEDLVKLIINRYTEFKRPLIDILTNAEINNTVPPIWIFNDFGHLSIKYFKDINNNYKLDKNESIMSDFIHTEPADEYFTSHGRSFELTDSHGCIHVHPKDIDEIIQYVKPGNVLEVHSYSEQNIPIGFSRKIGRTHYELHFFPYIMTGKNAGTMVLYSVKQV